MSHVTDDLELHALGALPRGREAEVRDHLASCAACQAEAEPLLALVEALPEALTPRDPPPALRDRLLATARDGAARTRGPRRLPRWLPVGALGAALVLLVALNVAALRGLAETTAERDELASVALTLSHGGRWWYMAGREDFAGAGGTLVMPGGGGRALALFHDLRPLAAGERYTLWLGDAEGSLWVRGATFTAEPERPLQTVELSVAVLGWERCAVSIERRAEGPREGPVIMESRIQTE